MIARTFPRYLAVIVVSLSLGACETANGGGGGGEDDRRGGSRERVGTVLGTIAGAWLGSTVGEGKTNTLSILTGTILGAYLGGILGRKLDERDRAMARDANERAMETPLGQRVSWSNPETGNGGTVKTTRETPDPETGATCREFEQTITTADGKTESAAGTACRQADGTWKIADSKKSGGL